MAGLGPSLIGRILVVRHQVKTMSGFEKGHAKVSISLFISSSSLSPSFQVPCPSSPPSPPKSWSHVQASTSRRSRSGHHMWLKGPRVHWLIAGAYSVSFLSYKSLRFLQTTRKNNTCIRLPFPGIPQPFSRHLIPATFHFPITEPLSRTALCRLVGFLQQALFRVDRQRSAHAQWNIFPKRLVRVTWDYLQDHRGTSPWKSSKACECPVFPSISPHFPLLVIT